MLKSLSVIATVVLVAAVSLLCFDGGLLSPAPVVIALQVFALLVMVWARLTFGWRSFHFAANPTEGGLVTSGPYRYVRHPIYAAVLMLVWSGVIANLSIRHVLLAAVLTLGTAVRILSEERLVKVRYPEYEDYARRTRRVIPFLL